MDELATVSRNNVINEPSNPSRYLNILKVQYRYCVVHRYFNIDTISPSSTVDLGRWSVVPSGWSVDLCGWSVEFLVEPGNWYSFLIRTCMPFFPNSEFIYNNIVLMGKR